MTAVDYPPVLNTDQVAELLGLHVDTVRQLARDEVIPAHRIPSGRVFKYLTNEVLEWLRKQPHDPSRRAAWRASDSHNDSHRVERLSACSPRIGL